MLITFACPECKAEQETASTAAGTQVLCPQCSKTLTVPRKGPGPGVTIGQFRIQKLLGKGGMGEVYLARQTSMGRDVALKILPASLRGQKARVQRFFKEVQLLARLDHPNIVMAHETGEDDGILYLAMSYIPGDSLEQSLQRNGPMAETDALKLIDKLAGALDYAWREHRLLHRDIKPANILLASSGEAKLTDFGLAKCLDDATELTMSGDIIGSPNYMSPEQIDNCLDLDCRSDIYSLGTTLYHLLTGKLPFAGSSLMETLKKQVSESLPDPRIERPEISEACIILLEIMLAKNRNDRHADYAALRADIARVLAGERPTKDALHPGESVLLRLIGERAPRRPQPAPIELKTQTSGKSNGQAIKWAAGALLGIFVGIGLTLLARGSWRTSPAAASTGAVSTIAIGPVATVPAISTATSAPVALPALSSTPAADKSPAMLATRYREALLYAREHPDDFVNARKLLLALADECKGTEFENKIGEDIARMERFHKRSALGKAIMALRADVQAQIAQSNFAGALQRIAMDPAPDTAEMKSVRTALANEVKARQQAMEQTRTLKAAATKAKLSALADALADDLLKGNTTALTQRLEAARNEADLFTVTNEVGALGNLAQQAAGWPEQVAKSFEGNRGKNVMVEFKGGRSETIMVNGIAGEKINAQRQVSAGYVGRDFSISELSAGEKLKRLGDNSEPATKLKRGLVLARCANDWAAAEKEFAAGGPLGEALIRQAPTRSRPATETSTNLQVKSAAAIPTTAIKTAGIASAGSNKTTSINTMDPKERQAYKALLNLIKMAEVTEDTSNIQAVADAIRRKEYSTYILTRINEALIDFHRNYAQTETARENFPIIKALDYATRSLPPGQRPFKSKWRRD